MPLMRTRLILLACFVCAGVGFLSMALVDKVSPRRGVASEKWRPPAIGKHLAPVTVQISAPALPDRDNQEIELVGYVTLNQQIEGDVNYQWSLPAGVTLVDGFLNDGWAHVRDGETIETKISVVGFSKESAKSIALEGFVQIGQNKMGNTTVLASRPEDAMESVAPKMMEIKQQDEESSGKSRRHK